MLGVVGSSLKMVKFEPTTPNMLQQGGQTQATYYTQQCCDMLHWHVAIVWTGLKLNDKLSKPFHMVLPHREITRNLQDLVLTFFALSCASFTLFLTNE